MSDNSEGPLEESMCGESGDLEDEEELEDSVVEDMQRLEESFRGFNKSYRLINRIGEGTFSTVYKAEDLHYNEYNNDWDIDKDKENVNTTQHHKRAKIERRKPHYVAIKKIYVTSSPARIMNELELLHLLRHCDSIAPLITAFRDKDQVIAILPYFAHLDFRTYYRTLNISDMRIYFQSLFSALAAVHKQEIIHRDIKPTNFLYDVARQRGVLVDFGLAEREGTDYQPCVCELRPEEHRRRLKHSYRFTHEHVQGFPKADQRPSLRANRAGTRGFRAPEVLFKCTAQTTKLDIWAAGVILLTIMARRFPFFNSADDVDAVVEITTLFGRRRMSKCAMQHGQLLETNIPTIGEDGFSLEKIINWSLNRRSKDENGNKIPMGRDEQAPCNFLYRCMELDPQRRMSAEEALQDPFLAGVGDQSRTKSTNSMQ
ncbi:MAG: hypothetical protein M1828_004411 [Chrysothrix sp. TS-e1954]|nr:MAG: hypothetical protein M1828_004411 [Chrysothrix sp. TS-e1954]